MYSGTTKAPARDKSFECPCCSAELDERGYEFASRVVKEGVTYFCNNPTCNGGRHSPQGAQGAIMQGEISTSDV